VPGKGKKQKKRVSKVYIGSPADKEKISSNTEATDGSIVSKLSKEALTALEMANNVSDTKKVEEYLRRQMEFNSNQDELYSNQN
jgi:hypothetical protein